MSARRPWRSGWCGRDAAAWQHGHCLGGHDGVACICECHQRPPVAVSVAEIVDVAALEQLVETLGQVVALPGLVPPAAHRLRAAAVELLQDLDGAGGAS